MNYDELLIESTNIGLIVKEKRLKANKGRIMGNRVAISSNISINEKNCVLAEELGHYHTTSGDILNQASESDLKQELRARRWAYDKLVTIDGLIESFKKGLFSKTEIADYLNITEEFLIEALNYYKQKYGILAIRGDYIIYFEPVLSIMCLSEIKM